MLSKSEAEWQWADEYVFPLQTIIASERGRYVVASRGLSPGELIWAEQPFSHVTDEKRCQACYRSLVPPQSAHFSCKRCAQPCFCSSRCHTSGASDHAAECEIIQNIAAAQGASDAILSAARGLRVFFRLLNRVHTQPAAFSKVEASLQEHYSDAPADEQQCLDAMAGMINRLVPSSLRMEEKRLAKLVSRVNTNGFAVADPAGTQLGSALYPRAAVRFNHSCVPTAVVSFHGSTLRLHALRRIARGEEVSIPYTELTASRAERQASLKAAYGFDCSCPRCVSPPSADAELDGWRCSGCTANGEVAPGQSACSQCGAAHVLSSHQRAAMEAHWRQSLDEVAAGLGSSQQASERVQQATARLLATTEEHLCGRHVLRIRARRLLAHALGELPQTSKALLCSAIERCLEDRRVFRPPGHPGIVYYEQWLARAQRRG